MISKLKSFWQSWNKTIIAVCLSVAVSFLVFSKIQFPAVDGESMLPTYYDDEHIIIYRTQNVSKNDIVVVWCGEINDYIVKRVIGTENDIIEIKNGSLYRNGVRLYESYIDRKSVV